MTKYRIETGVNVKALESLVNDEGWTLQHVLHSYPMPDDIPQGRVVMAVLLSKTVPDTPVVKRPKKTV